MPAQKMGAPPTQRLETASVINTPLKRPACSLLKAAAITLPVGVFVGITVLRLWLGSAALWTGALPALLLVDVAGSTKKVCKMEDWPN